ncbi:hypothetical protein HanPI659440_Chr08g0299841 [Helianthus annuus]|nr:hypothetical protein HanPI659440_Chr08g0299841 [Helianthus annuus]
MLFRRLRFFVYDFLSFGLLGLFVTDVTGCFTSRLLDCSICCYVLKDIRPFVQCTQIGFWKTCRLLLVVVCFDECFLLLALGLLRPEFVGAYGKLMLITFASLV